MINRLVQAADFKRLMAVPPAFRSAHFAVHHLVDRPASSSRARKSVLQVELSTHRQERCPQVVEDSQENPDLESPDAGFPRWIGCVVPKRHARRAVTRNLIKRQVYAACERVEPRLTGGMWLVRLKQPFATQVYPSAASEPLRAAVREELDQLLGKAVRKTLGGAAVYRTDQQAAQNASQGLAP